MKDYKAVIYVAGGACSYGLLATIVKYANNLGVHTSVLTFLQFLIGYMFLTIMNRFIKAKHRDSKKISLPSKMKLIAWGTSLGLTSTLYYLSIQYIPVSVGIILLMQSIWISLLVEMILIRRLPSVSKLVGVFITLLGTILATNIIYDITSLDYRGLLLGFGAGISYTISIFSASRVESTLPSSVRSQFLVLGGLLLILLFWNIQIVHDMTYQAWYWGGLIALFGTILPPLLFTKGIPHTGLAVGNIVASLEIPVSMVSAVILLHEKVAIIQWCGVLIILIAVVMINLRK